MGIQADSERAPGFGWKRKFLSSWPRVFGFSWWNEAWQNDDNPDHDTSMRLQDNPALAAVFKKQVGGNANVLGRTLYATVSGQNRPRVRQL
jgi:hypothetical protein